MTKCKKLLVMLLSVVFAVTLAVGLAACGGGNNDTYTVTVTDTTSSKAPVANVYLELYYVKTNTVTAGEGVDPSEVGQTYTEPVTLAHAKTNTDGKAQFVATNKAEADLAENEFNPVEGADYLVKIAENGATSTERALPSGYLLHTEKDANDLDITSFSFDNSKNAKLTLDYLPNHFYHAQRTQHPYYREYDWKDNANHVKESTEKSLQLEVKAGILSYFDFAPYKTSTVSESDINPDTGAHFTKNEASEKSIEIANQAILAASGKYKFTVSPSTAVLRQFNASAGFTLLNAEGVPTDLVAITGDAPAGSSNSALYTGTNYIEVDLDRTKSASSCYFYVTASADTTVTVTVERTGDATEVNQLETVNVQPYTQNIPAFPMGKDLTAVPIDGSVTISEQPNESGYYYMVSDNAELNGKVIAVMLTDTNIVGDRIGGTAISDWTNASITNEEEGKIYNYLTLISTYVYAYPGGVNGDGVYGLNQDLYDLLEKFSIKFDGADPATPAKNMLLPCVYYAAEADAFKLNEATDIEYTGSAVTLVFTPDADGWFIFDEPSMPFEIDYIMLDGDYVFDSLAEDELCTAFYLEAGMTYSFDIYFVSEGGNVPTEGQTYQVTLLETEEPAGATLTVGEDQEVTLKGPGETEMGFDGVAGAYTITVNPGMMLFGQTITVYLSSGMGPAQPVTLVDNSATVTLYPGYKLIFSCEANYYNATILVTIEAAQS